MKHFFLLLIYSSLFTALSAQPALKWNKSYGGSGAEQAQAIDKAIDGNYYIASNADSNSGQVAGCHGNKDCWILKLDTAGTIIWAKAYGGSANEAVECIQATKDGGCIFAGYTFSSDGDVTGGGQHGICDIWVVKLSSAGAIQWQKCYGSANGGEAAFGIRGTPDGGYMVVGSSNGSNGDVTSNQGQDDYWVIKIDGVGNLLWQKSFGGSNEDYATAVTVLNDGSYIVSGYAASIDYDCVGNHGAAGIPDALTIKLDANGNVKWKKLYGGSDVDNLFSIKPTSDGNVIMAGTSGSIGGNLLNAGNHGSRDFWLLKTDTAGKVLWSKCYGSTSADVAQDVIEDNGYIAVGEVSANDGNVTGYNGKGVSQNIWAVKTDIKGNLLWQNCIGSAQNGLGYTISLESKGVYVIAGYNDGDDGIIIKDNHGGNDVWVLKLKYNNVGISELENEKMEGVSVWPNPVADGKLSVQSVDKIDIIEGYNLLGEKVLQTKATNIIDVSNLNKGVYFIKLHSANRDKIFKILVQ